MALPDSAFSSAFHPFGVYKSTGLGWSKQGKVPSFCPRDLLILSANLKIVSPSLCLSVYISIRVLLTISCLRIGKLEQSEGGQLRTVLLYYEKYLALLMTGLG